MEVRPRSSSTKIPETIRPKMPALGAVTMRGTTIAMKKIPKKKFQTLQTNGEQKTSEKVNNLPPAEDKNKVTKAHPSIRAAGRMPRIGRWPESKSRITGSQTADSAPIRIQLKSNQIDFIRSSVFRDRLPSASGSTGTCCRLLITSTGRNWNTEELT